MAEHCHCGRLLHYADAAVETAVREMIALRGEFVPVTCNGRTWMVQRHYIALHGLKAAELPDLGFEEAIDGAERMMQMREAGDG